MSGQIVFWSTLVFKSGERFLWSVKIMLCLANDLSALSRLCCVWLMIYLLCQDYVVFG